jgi:hypothetical protein
VPALAAEAIQLDAAAIGQIAKRYAAVGLDARGIRRSQLAVRAGDIDGGCGRFGTLKHESDRASLSGCGSTLQSGMDRCSRECSVGSRAFKHSLIGPPTISLQL